MRLEHISSLANRQALVLGGEAVQLGDVRPPLAPGRDAGSSSRAQRPAEMKHSNAWYV